MSGIPPDREERTDVMLAVGDTADAAEHVIPQARHFEEEIPLTVEVSIGPLPHELREAILDACERRGQNCELAVRQFGSLYGLIRRNAPRGSWRGDCDPDHELSRIAAIARLVRPHGMSLGSAARVIRQPNKPTVICPAQPEGPGAAAFVIDVESRWIRDEDVDVTRELLVALAEREPPPRIGRAMFNHELLHWQYSVEVRWMLLATALEGLVHTNDKGHSPALGQRDQFVVRLRKLADFVPGLEWSEAQLDSIYDHRNETMHGGDISALWKTEAFPPLYGLAENGLRAIVKAAILRPAIAQTFATDDTVRVALGSKARARRA